MIKIYNFVFILYFALKATFFWRMLFLVDKMTGDFKVGKLFFSVCGLLFCSFFYCEANAADVSSTVKTAQKQEDVPSKKLSTAKKEASSEVDASLESKDTAKEKKESLEDLEKRAAENNIDAMLDLGYIYLYGTNGAITDYSKALYYYQKAAESKNAVALNNLGSLYFNGIGTPVDYTKAIALFDEAAKQGSDDAAVNLAIIYLGAGNKSKDGDNLGKALVLLKQVQKDNSIAAYLLGYAHLRGFLVKQDDKEAFRLIKEAADDKYDEAQLVLANFYINGRGTPKSYRRAVQYLNAAAMQGNSAAIMQLADILAEGKIYTRDIKKAHIFYNIASVMDMKGAAEKRDALEKSLKIEDLLTVQAEAENYKEEPSEKTSFIRKTYGKSLKAYIDKNLKKKKL